MSDYGGYDTEEEEFAGYVDEEYDIENDFYEPESLVNGHDKDEEDIRQDQLQDEFEKVEGRDDEPDEEKEEEEESDEEMEEEVVPKTSSRIIPSALRKTNPNMTKFEYAYLVSQRAMAIENGSPLMNLETKHTHSIEIAKEETVMGLNPIIIQRVMPNGDIEEWKCKELRLPKNYI